MNGKFIFMFKHDNVMFIMSCVTALGLNKEITAVQHMNTTPDVFISILNYNLYQASNMQTPCLILL